MKPMFSCILYGGDYNPEQWDEETWQQDMRLFREAHINTATVNVFSWAGLQCSETEYHFEKLDKIMDLLEENNISVILATSTGALPAWMVKRYPSVARTDFQGHQHVFGQRENACPNSPVFRGFSHEIALRLAERYHNRKNLVCWHISNEYSGECYCENCAKAFRGWLQRKYQTIEELNKAWNMAFWGRTIYDWEEIVPPNMLSEAIDERKTALQGATLDYRRFMSDSMLENYKGERDAIRRYDAVTPITTNLMGTYKGLDYFKWAKEMDIVSWDNYPSYNTPWSFTAMSHDLMRGLKDQPFMLMEQTPSQQNWQPYNSLKRPGQMRAQSYQTIAHGADTILFFQLRRSRGGCEKMHGAVISHAGTSETRVFREVTELGTELEKLQTTVMGATSPHEVGILFDWDCYWAIESTIGPNNDISYVQEVHHYYRYFYEHHIPVTMISPDDDFSRYKLIVAPCFYMVKENMGEKIECYTENSGCFVTTYMSGLANESDLIWLGGYPGPLRKVCGCWVEETDALAPEQNGLVRLKTEKTGKCGFLCDIIHPEGAEIKAWYASDFYRDTPAVTCNSFGKGKAWYIGTRLEDELLNEIMDEVSEKADLKAVIEEKTSLEVTVREKEGRRYYFIMNLSNDSSTLPAFFDGSKDMLRGNILSGGQKVLPWDSYLVVK